MAGRYQALARVLHCFWLHGFDGGCSPTVPPFPWLFGKVATRDQPSAVADAIVLAMADAAVVDLIGATDNRLRRSLLAIPSGGMDASRENPGWCGSWRAEVAAALQLRFVLRCGRAGGMVVRAARDADAPWDANPFISGCAICPCNS
jgi:hypothetical protein